MRLCLWRWSGQRAARLCDGGSRRRRAGTSRDPLVYRLPCAAPRAQAPTVSLTDALEHANKMTTAAGANQTRSGIGCCEGFRSAVLVRHWRVSPRVSHRSERKVGTDTGSGAAGFPGNGRAPHAGGGPVSAGVIAEIARRLGVSHQVVSEWRKAAAGWPSGGWRRV
jgi:hypothetical protein